jgi:hypothetical protein
VRSPLALWPGRLSFGILQKQTTSSPISANGWQSAREVDSKTDTSPAQGSSQVSAKPLLPLLDQVPHDVPGEPRLDEGSLKQL